MVWTDSQLSFKSMNDSENCKLKSNQNPISICQQSHGSYFPHQRETDREIVKSDCLTHQFLVCSLIFNNLVFYRRVECSAGLSCTEWTPSYSEEINTENSLNQANYVEFSVNMSDMSSPALC